MLIFLYFQVTFSKPLHPGTKIQVVGTKMNPYYTPIEIYNFNFLPTCLASSSEVKKNIKKNSKFAPINIQFLTPVQNNSLCSIHINEHRYQKFKKAIHRQFIYQLYIRKLPLWGRIGTEPPGIQSKTSSTQYLFSHYHFSLSYSNNHIVEVSMIPENPILLKQNSTIHFSYSVEWIASNKHYSERFNKYYDMQFFAHPTRHYSVINSGVLTFLLILLTLFILISFLQNDFRHLEDERETPTLELDFRADRGWKNIHADAFRPPSSVLNLSVLIGFGAQLLTTIFGFIISNLIFKLYKNKNSQYNTFAYLYSFSAFIGGYFSAGFYRHWSGISWLKQLIISSIFIPMIYGIYQMIVFIAEIIFGTEQSLNIIAIIIFITIIAIIITPLTIIGGLIGRHHFIIGDDPAPVAVIPRIIPTTPFYLKTFSLMLIIGVCIYFPFHNFFY